MGTNEDAESKSKTAESVNVLILYFKFCKVILTSFLAIHVKN